MILETAEGRILGYIGAARRQAKEHRLSEATLKAEWRALEAMKSEHEQPLERRLRSVLSEQQEAIMRGIQQVRAKQWRALLTLNASMKADLTPLVVQTLIDWADWAEQLRDAAFPALQSILQAGFEAGLGRVGIDATDVTSDTPLTRSAIDQIVDAIAETQGTTQQQIAETIQRGLVDGRTQDEIETMVRSKTDDLTGYRLRATVRTASNGGFEAGQLESFKQAGVTHRSWLSQRDQRVRTPANDERWNHRSVDGQEVRVEDPFIVEGEGGITESLMYPADPSGSKGNIINCRCGQLPQIRNRE